MNEIFTVYVTATHYYDEDGEKTAYSHDEKSWVDSYWTDETAALTEAQRLWENDSDEFIEKIIVFGRKLNVSGNGENEWNSKRDRLVKCWR
jgi:hypothetical protein